MVASSGLQPILCLPKPGQSLADNLRGFWGSADHNWGAESKRFSETHLIGTEGHTALYNLVFVSFRVRMGGYNARPSGQSYICTCCSKPAKILLPIDYGLDPHEIEFA